MRNNDEVLYVTVHCKYLQDILLSEKNAEPRTLKIYRDICLYRDIISRNIYKKLLIVVKVGRNEIGGLGQQ